MNNVTTAGPYTNATVSYPPGYSYDLYVNPVIVVRFYQIGYPITFLLGFIGNTASLITFSHSTLRKVSTGCLYIILAISDTLYLLICIFDFLEFGLKIPFYGHVQYDELCRFRLFVMYVSQVLSSWILVTISVDRWIRTRFPYKSAFLCTPKKALLVVGVLFLIDVAVHAPMLTPLYGMLIPGFSILACGATSTNVSYLTFYMLQWSVVQILIICLIPVSLMLVIFMDIFISVRIRKRAVIQQAQFQHGDNRTNHQKHLQLQMLILMLTRASIFLITTLPLAIYKITAPREANFTTSIFRIASIWTGLTWFQSLNYAINFYSHCLTSTLFRKEFKRQMSLICFSRQTRVEVLDTNKIGHHAQPIQ